MPPIIIQHDRQHRQAVPLRDPIHAAGHREEERPVRHDLAHEAGGAGREFDAQRGAAGPAEAAAAAVEPGAGDGRKEGVGNEGGVGDGFDGEDGVFGEEGAEAGGEVGGGDGGVGVGDREGLDFVLAGGVGFGEAGAPEGVGL